MVEAQNTAQRADYLKLLAIDRGSVARVQAMALTQGVMRVCRLPQWRAALPGRRALRRERKEALFRRQIEETIQAHFDKQCELLAYGVKVLSLFFIDRVASYRDDYGIVKRLFEEADKRSDEKEAEKRAYELIMQRKEKLLSFDEPVSFIFAHSAIREGWDNPNVFQICALRETKGSLDLGALQNSNEDRKVRCAREHFAVLGMSYLHITGDMIG